MTDISIIIPIYNAEKYLKECIDSLVNQTKKELEFILVNDGSTDSTEEIIKSYKDKRIKYFKNKNQGIGKTRNFGIEKATGKYIMFLDSDDYLELTACEELYEKAEKDNLDLVVCDFYKLYENGTREDISLPSFKNTTLKKTPELLTDINLAPWNKIYKRDLIVKNNIKFVEDLKYEDTPFVAECFDRAKKIGKVDSKLNAYIIHGNSETTVRDERIFHIIKILDKIRVYFEDKEYIQETLKKYIVKTLTNYTIQQRVQKNIKVGMKFIDAAFDYMKKYVPDYKDNKYYENRGILRRTIEKNKTISKIYCTGYNLLTEKPGNESFDTKVKNIMETPSMNLAIMIMSYFLLVLTAFSIFSFLHLSNALSFIQVVSILIPILIYGIKSKNTKKSKLIVILIYLLMLIGLPFIFGRTYDLTVDGNSYHKTAIAFIKNGWNPIYETSRDFQKTNDKVIPIEEDAKVDLWIEHYPKATWIIAANIYNMTGNIESGKCMTFILTIVLMIITYNCLKTILSRFYAFGISLLIALNPITLTQLFSYYIDSIMGIFFAIELMLLFMINPMKKQNNLIWLLLVAVCTFFVNLKFTGLLYSGVIAAVFYFYWLFKYKKEKDFWKYFLIITRNFIIVFATAIFIVGADPYIKNTIDHYNPLYPLFGEDKVDIITTMQPKVFGEISAPHKFVWSLFSQTQNVVYASGEEPTLKWPFQLYRREVSELLAPDVRIGGFGPFFALIFIFSSIFFVISTIKLYKNEKKNFKYIILSAIAIIITMILVGESWWARYVPQLYLLPIGAIALTLYTAKYYKKQIMSYLGVVLIIGAIILNTGVFAYVNYVTINAFREIEHDLVEIERMDNPKIKLTTSDLYGYLYTLEDRNIDYQRVKEIPENKKKFIYYWRLEIETNEELPETN